MDDGGEALSYTKVKNLLLRDKKVYGVTIEDKDFTSSIDLQAPVVINATGAWADRIRNIINSEERIRPLRGSHIIIPKFLYPMQDVMTFLHADDKSCLLYTSPSPRD